MGKTWLFLGILSIALMGFAQHTLPETFQESAEEIIHQEVHVKYNIRQATLLSDDTLTHSHFYTAPIRSAFSPSHAPTQKRHILYELYLI